MIQFIVVALIASHGIWQNISKPGEVDTDISTFDIPVSSLKTEIKPLYYRDVPLVANSRIMKNLGAQEAMATAARFPNTLSCLMFEPEDKIISLARLNTAKFETTSDLEICLQRVANELGDLSKVEPWLREIGFGSVEERSISALLAAKSRGLSSEKVAVFTANWRGRDFLKELLYPMSAKFNLANVFLSFGFYPRNMYLTLVIHRQDMHVISIDVIMIFL